MQVIRDEMEPRERLVMMDHLEVQVLQAPRDNRERGDWWDCLV